MTKLAANLTMLFNELPFLDRFEAAANAGFNAVEFLFPYAFDVEEIAVRLAKSKLALVLHNLPAGNWEEGERGIACHPDRIEEFKAGVETAMRYAKALGVKQVNCLAGIKPAGISDEEAHQTFVSNLKFAADKLKTAGIRLLIEPINTFDIPGFFLSRTKQAIAIIQETASDNLFLQYDIYHAQRMEGELINTIKANLALIKHIQLADNPGRFEPGTGEINYHTVFAQLNEMGYQGWIGCEYKPKAGTLEGLGWRKVHGV
ncbi:MAG: hydroxypyruvate isomerase [Pseudomonadota bacterium]